MEMIKEILHESSTEALASFAFKSFSVPKQVLQLMEETLQSRTIAFFNNQEELIVDTPAPEPVDIIEEELIKVFSKHSLANLNLSMMPETVFFYGNIRYTFNESLGSGLAGAPVSLTEDTIRSLHIFEVNVDSIFIIENLAVFQELLKRKYYRQSNVLVLWGAGYLSSPKKILVNKILKARDIPIYIWSDLDLEGLMLTKNMLEEFQWTKSTNKPILMTNNELELTKGNFKGATRINKGNEELQKIFGDVVSLIESGLSMEQEELFIHFEKISGKLP